jgi:hypothetical protein
MGVVVVEQYGVVSPVSRIISDLHGGLRTLMINLGDERLVASLWAFFCSNIGIRDVISSLMKVIHGPVTPGTLVPVAKGSGAEALRGVGVWADEAIMMNIIRPLKRLNSEKVFSQGDDLLPLKDKWALKRRNPVMTTLRGQQCSRY